jgi:uncharacterized membrane protein
MPDTTPDIQDTQPFRPPPPRTLCPYSRTTIWLVLALTALILALWMLGTPPGVHGKLDAVGYAVCHQIGERSFMVNGEPLPLCARCTGMYVGVMIGLGLMLAGGRGRASQFAPVPVLAVLAVFVVIMGLDGVNSYLHLFPGYQGPYAPTNPIRLITGSLTGLAMIQILLPVFNTLAWQRPDPQRTLHGFGELAGVLLVIGLVDGLILLRDPLVLTVFGFLTGIGPVVVLVMVFSVLFLSFTRRENRARTLRDMLFPMVAGLLLTLLLLGSITVVRYQLTGTWDGFDFSAVTHTPEK